MLRKPCRKNFPPAGKQDDFERDFPTAEDRHNAALQEQHRAEEEAARRQAFVLLAAGLTAEVVEALPDQGECDKPRATGLLLELGSQARSSKEGYPTEVLCHCLCLALEQTPLDSQAITRMRDWLRNESLRLTNANPTPEAGILPLLQEHIATKNQRFPWRVASQPHGTRRAA